MGFDVLGLLGLLSGDPKKLLKNLATVQGFWEYVLGRIEDRRGRRGEPALTDAEKAVGRLFFDELVSVLGLRKILKKEA
jgi:hypothetical protein